MCFSFLPWQALVFCYSFMVLFFHEMFPLLYCRTPVLSAGVRLGGHRAQGPGRHQGAAAALISPKPATTFSGYTWGEEENKSRVPRERKRLVSWWTRKHKTRERSKKRRTNQERSLSTSLLPPWEELPAPTATWQLRAAFYSCTPTANKNQYSSAVTAHHLPTPFLPPWPWSQLSAFTLEVTSPTWQCWASPCVIRPPEVAIPDTHRLIQLSL